MKRKVAFPFFIQKEKPLYEKQLHLTKTFICFNYVTS